MSNDITIGIDVDDTLLIARMDDVDKIVDEATRKAAEARREILQGIQGVMQGMNYAIQSIRLFVRATGQTLDPLQNAVLSMVSSTTSLIISTATAMQISSFGVLTGVALALAAFAYGFQSAQTAKIMADMAATRDQFADVEANLIRLMERRSVIGGALF